MPGTEPEEKVTERTTSLRNEVGAGPVCSLPPKRSLEKQVPPTVSHLPAQPTPCPRGRDQLFQEWYQPTWQLHEAPEDNFVGLAALVDYGEE